MHIWINKIKINLIYDQTRTIFLGINPLHTHTCSHTHAHICTKMFLWIFLSIYFMFMSVLSACMHEHPIGSGNRTPVLFRVFLLVLQVFLKAISIIEKWQEKSIGSKRCVTCSITKNHLLCWHWYCTVVMRLSLTGCESNNRVGRVFAVLLKWNSGRKGRPYV